MQPGERPPPMVGALLGGAALLSVHDGGRVRLDRRPGAGGPRGGAVIPLAELLRTRLAPLPARDRERVCGEVCAAVTRLPAEEQIRVSADLRRLRQALRERLPQPANDGSVVVDKLLRIDPESVYVSGRSPAGLALTFVTPEGERLRVPPPSGPAFAVLLRHALARPVADGWLVEARTPTGEPVVEVPAPAVTTSAEQVVDSLHEDAADAGVPLTDDDCLALVTRVRRALREQVDLVALDRHGAPTADPRVTVLVPVGARPDRAEFPLAAALGGHGRGDVDLLYVASADEGAAAIRQAFRELAELYRVPFRAMVLDRAVPDAIAIDAGMGRARCPEVVVVIPEAASDDVSWPASAAVHRASGGVLTVVPRRHGEVRAEAFVVDRDWFLASGGLPGFRPDLDTELADLCRRAAETGRITSRLQRGPTDVSGRRDMHRGGWAP